MTHPLTSKERRGLVAVAAAALLCIGSGFIFRNCGSGRGAPGVVVVDADSVAVGDSIAGDSVSERSEHSDSSEKSEKSEESEKSEKSGKHRKSKKSDPSEKSDRSDKSSRKKSKKTRSEKTYPSRSPLDEPISDQR